MRSENENEKKISIESWKLVDVASSKDKQRDEELT